MSMHLGINFGGSLEPVAAMGGMAPGGSDVGEGDPGHPPYAGVGREPVGAFDFYWDEGGEVYRMRDPVVVTPDGGNVECESPGELEFGKKYYCVVTKGEGEGEYKAKVLPEGEAGELDGSGYKSWWKVPLFKVPHRRFEENESDGEAGTQYHVGAIVVGGDGSSAPAPFDYVEDAEGRGQIVRCSFYFNGEAKSLPGFSGVPDSGPVYLRRARTTRRSLRGSSASERARRAPRPGARP